MTATRKRPRPRAPRPPEQPLPAPALPLAWVGRADAGLAGAWEARRQRAAWLADPAAWAAHRGIELWSRQREVLTAAATHPRVAVRSAHSTGKSFSMSVLAAYWLDVHPPGEARVITTAPTYDQVRGILWNEINQLWERYPDLPGDCNQTEIWLGRYQAAIGRKSSDYQPSSFPGFHARYLLVIVDEADGISTALWNAIDTLATNAGAVIVAIGNPDDPTSEFRRRQSDQGFGGSYHTIKIPAWCTPNFSGEPVSQLLRDVLLSPGWVEERRVAWGGAPGVDQDDPRWAPDHPFWSSKVEAEYPTEDGRTVIRLSDLLRARRSELTGDEAERRVARHGVTLGIDLAGSDRGDETIARAQQGWRRLLGTARTRISDPEELDEWLAGRVDEFAAARAHVDADGIGHGHVGALRRARGRRCVVHAVRSAVAASDPKSYKNRRAEMWWGLRELLKQTGGDQVDFTALDDETAGQLVIPRYSTPKGRILIESKDEIRKRIGRSPDDADALVYAFARDAGTGPARITRPSGALR